MKPKSLSAPGTRVANADLQCQRFCARWKAQFDRQSDREAAIIRQVRERFLGPNVLRHGSAWRRKGLTAEGRLKMCRLIEQAQDLTPRTSEETAERLNAWGHTPTRGQKWTKHQVLRFQTYRRLFLDCSSANPLPAAYSSHAAQLRAPLKP